ncbi:gluconate 2-dehydrogenase subunit 3 family protein [Flavivirga rizhaonensis]|uniref:Gluconate 2-dehydrogenase subunit 3 family protein n=1 Tax=Flavivirga rizhaonensis TaxID=2559571 RepID=A0A4S1DZR9_9FLAO|nr:gluconate 2-dehydrogenase subunit 3 family protein [Flavivirga rizhaonensis]TGV03513.1 gluconate 2-dehydrogenase subunit 3 family protein [Flavivirga rizhaonensis]
MNRRSALKNLTMSLGYTVAAPTLFNMLASCTANAETWSPVFLSSEEKYMVIHLVDIILPASDNTPGALDVNIPQFLDLMYHDIEKKENQELFRKGANIFAKKLTNKFNLNVLDGKKEDFEKSLSSYFNVSKEETENILKEQRLPLTKVDDSKMENYILYKFLLSVKYYTLFGYFTSEKVGEDVLAYDPIPGNYQGCISINEATGGRAWSL